MSEHECPYCDERYSSRLDRDVHAVTAHDNRRRPGVTIPRRHITCHRCARDMLLSLGRCEHCGWEMTS